MLARRDLVGEEQVELGRDRLKLNGILLVDDEIRHRDSGFRIPGIAQGLKGLQPHGGVLTGQILDRLLELDLCHGDTRSGQRHGESREQDQAAGAIL